MVACVQIMCVCVCLCGRCKERKREMKCVVWAKKMQRLVIDFHILNFDWDVHDAISFHTLAMSSVCCWTIGMLIEESVESFISVNKFALQFLVVSSRLICYIREEGGAGRSCWSVRLKQRVGWLVWWRLRVFYYYYYFEAGKFWRDYFVLPLRFSVFPVFQHISCYWSQKCILIYHMYLNFSNYNYLKCPGPSPPFFSPSALLSKPTPIWQRPFNHNLGTLNQVKSSLFCLQLWTSIELSRTIT